MPVTHTEEVPERAVTAWFDMVLDIVRVEKEFAIKMVELLPKPHERHATVRTATKAAA
jgi:hypothetical protein